jgi:hypothetical protein
LTGGMVHILYTLLAPIIGIGELHGMQFPIL